MIIVGSGAGGGTLAHTLAPSGKRILLLERGEFLPREMDEAQRSRSTCIRCTWCDGYPCLVHAKSDAEVIAVRPLLDRENLTPLTGAEVTRLETDDSGRTVTGVVVSRNGNQEVYRGDIVAISAGAANSAKLLLNSATDAHPHGLANGSDQVGRNYMFHNCKAVVALSRERNDTVFQKTLLPQHRSGEPGPDRHG
jgi:choline dehydrogenase-like flavoprotein